MVHHRSMTLIELLVVILITAILLALILASLNHARARAIQIHCFNNLKQVATASIAYNTDYFKYPAFVNQRPYSDYLSGRTSTLSYLNDELLRCPGIVHWRGKPYNSLRVYGIFEPIATDSIDAALDIRAGRFWEHKRNGAAEDLIFHFERAKNPSGISLWRDCIMTGTTEKPHWKYHRTISANYGAKLAHLQRSAGAYIDGHVESKKLRELNEEPMKIEAAFNVSGEIEEIQ